MRTYVVTGFDRHTGQRRTITVRASSAREARTLAYDQLTYPEVQE